MDRRLNKYKNNKVPATTAAQARSSFFIPTIKNKKNENKREFLIKIKNNEYKVKEMGIILTELHKDIIDAIFIAKRKHKETETGYQMLYNLTDVYNIMNKRISRVELKNKIQEIRTTTFFLQNPADTFQYYDFNIFSKNKITNMEYGKGKGFNKNKINYYYLVEISKEYLLFEYLDIQIYLNDKTLKEIINIKSAIVKHLIRYCLSQNKLNKDLLDIMNEINIVNQNMTRQYINKCKQEILKHKDILLNKFNIEIKIIEKTGRHGIFYTKNDNIYFKNDEKIGIEYKTEELNGQPNILINE